jgi:predicted nucleotidyltransferase
MRLSQEYISAIKCATYRLDPIATIYLFGSRTDDAKRGGDIDLLIFSQVITPEDKWVIIRCLHDTLGEQKIDIILAKDKKNSFVQIALETAVPL